jgi:hypothetical protein
LISKVIDVYLYCNADPRIVMTVNEYNMLVQNQIRIEVHLHSEPSDSDVMNTEEKIRQIKSEINTKKDQEL